MGTFFGSGPIRKTMREFFQSWMPPDTTMQPTIGARRCHLDGKWITRRLRLMVKPLGG